MSIMREFWRDMKPLIIGWLALVAIFIALTTAGVVYGARQEAHQGRQIKVCLASGRDFRTHDDTVYCVPAGGGR